MPASRAAFVAHIPFKKMVSLLSQTLATLTEPPLKWQTPDFCGNCGDVLNGCYALEKMPGQRLAHVGQATLDLIKYIESKEEELHIFTTRKTSFNAAMINYGSGRPDEKARGQRVILQQIEVNRERTGAYEWMPKKDYIALHGDPVVGKHGVVLMQRGGEMELPHSMLIHARFVPCLSVSHTSANRPC